MMNDINSQIEEILRKIGKKSFVQHLYPELRKDINVTIEDIVSRHPEYNEYTLNSQKSRLSKARSIFREGKEKEALINIIYSEKTDEDVLKQAQEYIDKL